jgi:hypothetical protein
MKSGGSLALWKELAIFLYSGPDYSIPHPTAYLFKSNFNTSRDFDPRIPQELCLYFPVEALCELRNMLLYLR